MSFMTYQTVIAHIGMHKTGSTTLQRDLFPKLPNVKLIRGYDAVRSLLPSDGESPFTLLVSDESISATPAWGGERSLEENFQDRLAVFHRLLRPSRYIVAFRRHSTWIRSMYCQYLHEGGTEKLSDFFVLGGCGLLRLAESPWRTRYLQLARLVGHQNVFVYMQEDLLSAPERVVPSMVHFICQSEELDHVAKPNDRGAFVRSRHNVSGHFGGYPTLRRLNAVRQWLRKYRIGRSLIRGFERIELTPRGLCQRNWLPRWWSSEMAMDFSAIDTCFDSDLGFVSERAAQNYGQWDRPTAYHLKSA